MAAEGIEGVLDGEKMLDTIMEEVSEFVFSVPDFGPGDALSVPAPDGTRLKLRLPQNALPGDRMYMGKNDAGDWVIKRVARPQTQTVAKKTESEGLNASIASADAAASPTQPERPDTPSMKDDRSDPDSVTIMCLGDSFTHGWHIPGGYRIHLWELMQRAGWKVRFTGSQKNGPKGIDRRHEGWPGYRIDELINGRGEEVDVNLQRDLCRHRPDIVLLLVGTNDVIDAVELESAGHRFVSLLDTIQAQLPEVKVVFGNLPSIRGMEAGVDQVNQQLLEAEQAANVCGLFTRLLDINSLLVSRDFHDSVHLNIRGFNKLARAFFKMMEEQDIVPLEARPTSRQEPPVSPRSAKRKAPGKETWADSPCVDSVEAERIITSSRPSKEAAFRKTERRSPPPGNASPRSGGGLTSMAGAAGIGSTSLRAPSPKGRDVLVTRDASPRRSTTPPLSDMPSDRPYLGSQSPAASPSLRLSSMLSGSDAGTSHFGSGHASPAMHRPKFAVKPPSTRQDAGAVDSTAVGSSLKMKMPVQVPISPRLSMPSQSRDLAFEEDIDPDAGNASSQRGPLSSQVELLPVGGEAARATELAIREDILRRVQQLQLRNGAAPGRPGSSDLTVSSTKAEAPGRPRRGGELIVEWNAGYEEGELGCVIS